ncbi:MAG: hypothetical protein ACYDH6_08005 [Acidimicrobiales bacterium]
MSDPPVSDAPAQLARRLREERTALVAALAAGTVDIASLRTDPTAAPVKVVVLAQAVPGLGKVRSRRVLEALGVIDAARWGDLAPPVLDRVVAALLEAATAPCA